MCIMYAICVALISFDIVLFVLYIYIYMLCVKYVYMHYLHAPNSFYVHLVPSPYSVFTVFNMKDQISALGIYST